MGLLAEFKFCTFTCQSLFTVILDVLQSLEHQYQRRECQSNCGKTHLCFFFAKPGEKLVSCGPSENKINTSTWASWIQFLKKEKLQNPSHFSFQFSRLKGANKMKKCSAQLSNSFCHLFFFFFFRHSVQAQNYCQVAFEILNMNNKTWMAIISLWQQHSKVCIYILVFVAFSVALFITLMNTIVWMSYYCILSITFIFLKGVWAYVLQCRVNMCGPSYSETFSSAENSFFFVFFFFFFITIFHRSKF